MSLTFHWVKQPLTAAAKVAVTGRFRMMEDVTGYSATTVLGETWNLNINLKHGKSPICSGTVEGKTPRTSIGLSWRLTNHHPFGCGDRRLLSLRGHYSHTNFTNYAKAPDSMWNSSKVNYEIKHLRSDDVILRYSLIKMVTHHSIYSLQSIQD